MPALSLLNTPQIVKTTKLTQHGNFRETLSALLALCEGIHWSPVDSPHNGPVMRNLEAFVNGMNMLLYKQEQVIVQQSGCWRFETYGAQ